MKLTKEEIFGVFSSSLIIFVGLQFIITSLVLNHISAHALKDFINFVLSHQTFSIVLTVLAVVGLAVGLNFLVCLGIYKLTKHLRTKFFDNNILMLKRKSFLNSIEVTVFVGTISIVAIPFFLLGGFGGDFDGFIKNVTQLWQEICKEPSALVLTIILIGVVICIIPICIYLFINNLIKYNAYDAIKALRFDKKQKLVTIFYKDFNGDVPFDQLDTLEIEVKTMRIPRAKAYELSNLIKIGLTNGFASIFSLETLEQNRLIVVYEAKILLKSDSTEFEIEVAQNSLFVPNMLSLFESLVEYKPYFKNFKYSFDGPKVQDVEAILKNN